MLPLRIPTAEGTIRGRTLYAVPLHIVERVGLRDAKSEGHEIEGYGNGTLRDPYGTATYEAEGMGTGRKGTKRTGRNILESTKELGITGDQGLTDYRYHGI